MHRPVVTDLDAQGVVEGRFGTEVEGLEVSLCLLTVGDLSLGFSEDFRFDLGAIEKDSRNTLGLEEIWTEFPLDLAIFEDFRRKMEEMDARGGGSRVLESTEIESAHRFICDFEPRVDSDLTWSRLPQRSRLGIFRRRLLQRPMPKILSKFLSSPFLNLKRISLLIKFLTYLITTHKFFNQ